MMLPCTIMKRKNKGHFFTGYFCCESFSIDFPKLFELCVCFHSAIAELCKCFKNSMQRFSQSQEILCFTASQEQSQSVVK